MTAATLALPWVALAVLELALRVGGYGDSYPLFVPYRDDARYLFPNEQVARRWFHGAFVPSTRLDFFRATKGSRTLRLFFQGESSAAGFPYGHGGAPSRMLEARLQATFPDRDVEVVNTALTAVSSYVLLDQADDILAQRPDAVLIYTGHNEYYGVFGAASTHAFAGSRALIRAYLVLRRLRVVQLVERVVSRRAEPARNDAAAPGSVMELMAGGQLVELGSARYEAGLAQFRANLDALLARYAAARVPVYVGTLVSDERDQPPLVNGRAPRGAADTMSAATCFALAREREARGDVAGARTLYRAAKERDALRFRAPEAMNAIIREVAARRGAAVVETQQAVERASPNGVPGHTLILEHLHPNLDGYFVIADAFYESLRTHGAFGAWTAPVPASDARRMVPVTALDSLAALLRTNRLTSAWPFQPHGAAVAAIADTLRPRTTLDSLALPLVNGQMSWAEATDRLRARAEQAGDVDEAIRAALALAAEYRYSAQPYVDAARVAMRARRDVDASHYAQLALARRETPESAEMAGLLALRSGDVTNAVPLLERASRLAPADPALRGALAAARMLPLLLARRAAAPRDTATLFRLAEAYALTRQYDSARATLRALLVLAPSHAAGRELLDRLPAP